MGAVCAGVEMGSSWLVLGAFVLAVVAAAVNVILRRWDGGEAGAVVGVGGAEVRGFAAAGGLDGAGEGESGGDGGEDFGRACVARGHLLGGRRVADVHHGEGVVRAGEGGGDQARVGVEHEGAERRGVHGEGAGVRGGRGTHRAADGDAGRAAAVADGARGT